MFPVRLGEYYWDKDINNFIVMCNTEFIDILPLDTYAVRVCLFFSWATHISDHFHLKNPPNFPLLIILTPSIMNIQKNSSPRSKISEAYVIRYMYPERVNEINAIKQNIYPKIFVYINLLSVNLIRISLLSSSIFIQSPF